MILLIENKKMKRLLTLIVLSLLCSLTYAQSNSNLGYGKLSLKGGYFGEFILHPGLYGGVDYNLVRNKHFDLHWDSEIGCFMHKWNNNTVFIQSTIATRFITSNSLFADVSLGLGYMLSMPNGDVYRVDKDGVLSINGRPITSHAKIPFAITFGWDGKRNRDIPWSIGLGVEAYMQTGYNHIMLPHAALKLGVLYHLKNTVK